MLRIQGRRISHPSLLRSSTAKGRTRKSIEASSYSSAAVSAVTATSPKARAGDARREPPWAWTPSNDLLDKLLIGKHTRVIYQGFTGRVATQNARDSLAYGTNIVGGVTSGKEGEHLGLPLLPTVQKAKDQLRPDATAVFVPSGGAPTAIQEAIEAEIPLIVAVAEHIPVHDMMRVFQMLRTSKKSILVGPNSPGIISPLGQCRIGFQPLPMYSPGNIGVIARSGTLSYEAVASLTRAGLGQSLCIGVGGDVLAGTDLHQAHRALQDHDDTHAIVLVGEIGGREENRLISDLVKIREREGVPTKPIYALVAGLKAPSGRIMGHAGAFQNMLEHTADYKRRLLARHNIQIVAHPEDFGPRIRRDQRSFEQRRSFHWSRRPTFSSREPTLLNVRHLHLKGPRARDLFTENGMYIENVDEYPEDDQGTITLGIQPSRDRRRAALYIAHRTLWAKGLEIDLDHDLMQDTDLVLDRFKPAVRGWANAKKDAVILKPITDLLEDVQAVMSVYRPLWDIFRKYEALRVTVRLHLTPSRDMLILHDPEILIDDSALKIPGRLDVARDADFDVAHPIDVAAEQHGIVYVTLNKEQEAGSPPPRIATIVNGAGLAMNTVDVLTMPPHDAPCVNFLDTGGKATADTVRRCFELVLRDARTAVILVNIFGGLTDCAMIAEGVMLAFREVDMRGVPVVVRLRGTNEEKGQKLIAESGLGLEVFDGFKAAASRVVELAYPERRRAQGIISGGQGASAKGLRSGEDGAVEVGGGNGSEASNAEQVGEAVTASSEEQGDDTKAEDAKERIA